MWASMWMPKAICAVSYTHLDVYKRQEYDCVTLDGEYKRDLSKGLPIEMPKNYYEDDNPENKPLLTWRATANTLYTNWLNYYVYQITPSDLDGTPF